MTVTAAQIVTEIAAIETAWNAIPSFDQATTDELSNLTTLIATAQSDVTSLLSMADADFTAAGAAANFASGIDPTTMISNLNKLDTLSDTLIALLNLNARLSRMAQTVAGVTT